MLVHVKSICAAPPAALSPHGAVSTLGVALPMPESAPVPPELTARILKWYAVPLVRPVTVNDVLAGHVLSLVVAQTSIHAPQFPPSNRRWYWYFVMSLSLGSSHFSVTCVLRGSARKFAGAAGTFTAGRIVKV